MVLKGLNVIQLQTKRAWEGKLEGVEGAGGAMEKHRESGFYFYFFLSEFSARLDIGCADY